MIGVNDHPEQVSAFSAGSAVNASPQLRPGVLVHCNSIPVHTDAVAGIGVTPDEWMTMLVMGPDVLHEFPTEIGR